MIRRILNALFDAKEDWSESLAYLERQQNTQSFVERDVPLGGSARIGRAQKRKYQWAETSSRQILEV